MKISNLISGFRISGEKRKSKAVGFGGKSESMFHNADNMPDTSFTCSSQEFPGLYADTEVECRVCIYCICLVRELLILLIDN